jgi:predicted anti-sigma-YlaC factor YlaD
MNEQNDCSRVADLLPEFLAGRVSDADDRLVRQHVERCGECRNRANAVSLLQQTPVPAPDPDRWNVFVNGVMEATERKSGGSTGARRWYLAAGLVAMVLLAVWWVRPGVVVEPDDFGIDVLASEFAELPEDEAALWTVGASPSHFMPAGFDPSGLSEEELSKLLTETGSS